MFTLRKWIIKVSLFCFTLIWLASCNAILPKLFQSTNATALPLLTHKTPITPTSTPTKPLILYAGTVELEATYPPIINTQDDNYFNPFFDFDTNQVIKEPIEKNDIQFALSEPRPDPYLVLTPSLKSAGRNIVSGEFNY